MKSGNKEAAKEIGKLIAAKAISLGIKEVCFDRAGYRYHGRVQALSDGAREGGLKFLAVQISQNKQRFKPNPGKRFLLKRLFL